MTDTTQNETNEVASAEGLKIEWSYSGKALRAQCFLFILLSLLLIGGGVYATCADWFGTYYLTAWYSITGLLLLFWGYHYTVYFYRVWTIRYRLTERHLYCYRGLFTHTCDSMELIHIDDTRLVRTLFDRLFNGGVGSLVIFCAADKTDSKLVLSGIDNPKEVYEKIDSLRTELRAKRSILTSGG